MKQRAALRMVKNHHKTNTISGAYRLFAGGIPIRKIQRPARHAVAEQARAKPEKGPLQRW